MRHRSSALLLLPIALASCAWALQANRHYVPDDTYITLRYARNLLEGHGPVWNPGERVEGATSLVGLLLAAAGGALGFDLLTAARLVNLTALLGLGLLLWRVLCEGGRRRAAAEGAGPSALAAAVPAAMTVGAFPLAIWVMGGLEGPVFALAVAVGVTAALRWLEEPGRLRRASAAGLLLGLVVVTRPDGAVFGLVAAAAAAARRPGRRPLAIFAATGLALPVAHEIFRLAYYGDWLPNTVYAKATGLPPGLSGRGLVELGEFLSAPPWLPLLAAISLIGLLIRGRGRAPRGVVLPLLAAVAYAAVIVRSGGDVMDGQRLWLPLLPLCGLALEPGLARVLARPALAGGRPGRFAGPLLVLAAAAALGLQVRHFAPLGPDQTAYVGRIVGEHIRGKWPPGTVVALNTAGTTPYFAPEYRYIDMLGLNDRHIARRRVDRIQLRWQRIPGHAKGDGRYVLGRRPDVIILGPAYGVQKHRPWFLSDLEMVEDPLFLNRYRPVLEGIPVAGRPFHERFEVTRGELLVFTYYERAR